MPLPIAGPAGSALTPPRVCVPRSRPGRSSTGHWQLAPRPTGRAQPALRACRAHRGAVRHARRPTAASAVPKSDRAHRSGDLRRWPAPRPAIREGRSASRSVQARRERHPASRRCRPACRRNRETGPIGDEVKAAFPLAETIADAPALSVGQCPYLADAPGCRDGRDGRNARPLDGLADLRAGRA